MNSEEKLVYMANQIARNIAPSGAGEAAEAVADHIAHFWDPRMKAGIFASDLSGLSPIAKAAVESLQEQA